MDRRHYTAYDSVSDIWRALELSEEALDSLNLIEDAECFPSSFKVDHIAQATIASSALAASLFHSIKHQKPVPKVTVPWEHACVEFKSERLYALDGKSVPLSFGTIGGLHKTADGYVMMHDSFPNHRVNALKILGLEERATRDEVAKKMLGWNSIDLETTAFGKGAVIVALRSFEEWDAHPQSNAVADTPILLRKLCDSLPYIPSIPKSLTADKCLRGIRVVEMSRVLAAPIAGKTLAAHGAEVIWITSPTLPDLPDLDRDTARGKRTVQLNIKDGSEKDKLLELLRTADVFIQSYRPGSLAGQGMSAEALVKLNPNLIIANLSAYGPAGPWSANRGFDSLVQTCSGINVADAERYGAGEPARVLPCQAFDHGAGYLLATGIIAALCKRGTKGGSYEVNVSLTGVMKYMQSLGTYTEKTESQRKDFKNQAGIERYFETRETGFGKLKAVRHSASVEGLETGWDIMPKPLGSDEPAWIM